jgi:hypothetical protein
MGRNVIHETVTNMNEIIPELVDFNVRDLKFLLVVAELHDALQRDADEASDLLQIAWSLDINRTQTYLTQEIFTADVIEGIKFIQSSDFERYFTLFSRYIDSD